LIKRIETTCSAVCILEVQAEVESETQLLRVKHRVLLKGILFLY